MRGSSCGQRAHELGERDAVRAIRARTRGRVWRRRPRPCSSTSGITRNTPVCAAMQRIGDGEVGRQRQRRVLLLGGEPRPEAQRAVAGRGRDRSPARGTRTAWRRAAVRRRRCGGQFGETRRQVGRGGACRRRAWPGCARSPARTPSSRGVAVGRDADREHDGRAVAVGQQARRPFRQRGRVAAWRARSGRYTVTPRFNASTSSGSPGRTNHPTSAIA